MFNYINTYLQIKFFVLTNQIDIYSNNLIIYRKSIPKVLIDNPYLSDDIKDLTLHKPSEDALQNIYKFKNLHSLCINLCEYKTLPDSIWQLESLKSLVLNQCQTNVISRKIEKLNNLESLELCCKIKTLPNEVMNLINLKSLNLSRSYLLSELPISLPTSLEEIILDNKNLKFDEEILCLPNLKYLDISDTPIRRIPDNIENCKKLSYLSIYTKAEVFSLSRNIGKLIRLNTLIFHGRGIKEINFEFNELKNLHKLKIEQTSINKLPDSICDCFKLNNFEISYSPIEELPVEIGKLSALTSIDLKQTNINKLRRSMSKLKKLTYLRIPNGIKLPSHFEEMEKDGILNIKFTPYYDDSELDDEEDEESFGNEFGIVNLN